MRRLYWRFGTGGLCTHDPSPVTNWADALPAKRVLQVQAILVVFAALIALPFGPPMVVSAVLGGGTCLVANGLSALWIFRDYQARHPERLLLRLYGGEVVKLAVVIGIFGTAFAVIDGLKIPVLLAAYLLVQVASAPIAAQFANSRGARALTRQSAAVHLAARQRVGPPPEPRQDQNRQDQNREMTDVDR